MSLMEFMNGLLIRYRKWASNRKIDRIARRAVRRAIKAAGARQIVMTRLIWIGEAELRGMGAVTADGLWVAPTAKPTFIAEREDGSYLMWPTPPVGFNVFVE